MMPISNPRQCDNASGTTRWVNHTRPDVQRNRPTCPNWGREGKGVLGNAWKKTFSSQTKAFLQIAEQSRVQVSKHLFPVFIYKDNQISADLHCLQAVPLCTLTNLWSDLNPNFLGKPQGTVLKITFQPTTLKKCIFFRAFSGWRGS